MVTRYSVSDTRSRMFRIYEDSLGDYVNYEDYKRLEQAANAILSLEGFIFAADDKERPVLSAEVVHTILRNALNRER